jgi:hypothetical protein
MSARVLASGCGDLQFPELNILIFIYLLTLESFNCGITIRLMFYNTPYDLFQ